jgi:hypothetical protein
MVNFAVPFITFSKSDAPRIPPRYGCAAAIWPRPGRAVGIRVCGCGGGARAGDSHPQPSRGSFRGMTAPTAGPSTEPPGGASWASPDPCRAARRGRMDVVHDTRAAGRPFRILPVVATWSRCKSVRAAGCRLAGQTGSQVLARVRRDGQRPRSSPVDPGTECQSRAREDWADRRGGHRDCLRPGNPRGERRHRIVLMGACATRV